MAKKILVVDDELDILKIITFRLKKMGYEVITAVDGQEALNLIQNEKPDLIFLDVLLPVIDGYEICRQIKADDKLKYIPIVLLTAINRSKVAEKAKEFKADDYIVKPFEPEELFEKVKKFIK